MRFEPIPQSIDISARDESLCDGAAAEPAAADALFGARQQAQAQAQVQAQVAAPAGHQSARRSLAKGLNTLSHKVRLRKIKLSKFNRLAQQLQQKLAGHSYGLGVGAGRRGPERRGAPLSASYDLATRRLELGDPLRLRDSYQSRPSEFDDQSEDWGSDFDEQSLSSSSSSSSSEEEAESEAESNFSTLGSNHSESQDSGHSTQHSATMSLGQIVKDVIDNCERQATHLSLGSGLARAESLCSDLNSSGDQSSSHPNSPPTRRPHKGAKPRASKHSPRRLERDDRSLGEPLASQPQHQISVSLADQTVSSLGTIDGLEYSLRLSTSCTLEAEHEAQSACGQLARPSLANPKPSLSSYIKQGWRDFARFKFPSLVKSTHIASREPAKHASLHYATNATDDTLLKRTDTHQNALAPLARSDAGLANHFVTLSNRKWKSCNLRSSILPSALASANASSLHDPLKGSPFSSGRNLAYLDNSRNFTDDDI